MQKLFSEIPDTRRRCRLPRAVSPISADYQAALIARPFSAVGHTTKFFPGITVAGHTATTTLILPMMKRGFTLIETIVVCRGDCTYFRCSRYVALLFYKTNAYTLEQSTAVWQARKGVEDAMLRLRESLLRK